MSPPIPSPPPKKRRIAAVASWEEQTPRANRDEAIGAASPGMFRSPMPGERMRGGRNFGNFVSIDMCMHDEYQHN